MNYELSSSEKIVLNTIRKNNNAQKNVLVDNSNLPWSTVTNALQSLEQKGWVSFQKEGNRELVVLNRSNVFFIGISVGSSNVKIVFTDLLCKESIDFNYGLNYNLKSMLKSINSDFERLSFDCGFTYKRNKDNSCRWCFVTPDSYFGLSDLLTNICDILLNYTDKNNINLAAICFVFPGAIDTENQTIIESKFSNQPITTSKIDYILDSRVFDKINQRNIKLHIDHNVKACTIYEYSDIKRKNELIPLNIAVAYLGIGLGIGLVINGALIRGVQNKAGQYGHILMSEYSDDYINNFFDSSEQITSNDAEKLTKLEGILRENVLFKVLNEKESTSEIETRKKYKETVTDELAELIKNTDSLYKRKLAFYLGLSISNIIKLLSIETFVFSGKLAKLYPVFQKELHFALMKFDVQVEIIISSDGEYSAAYGATEIAFEKVFDIPDFSI